MGEQWEHEMQKFVDNHKDEWVEAVKDPEKLSRFRSFINAPETPDPLFARMPMRDQNRPATLEEREQVLISGPGISFRDAHGQEVPAEQVFERQ